MEEQNLKPCHKPRDVHSRGFLHKKRHQPVSEKMAPRVGLEPTTLRLTAECSAIELPRSVLQCDTVVNKQHRIRVKWFLCVVAAMAAGCTSEN
jgi:hypothetical protein